MFIRKLCYVIPVSTTSISRHAHFVFLDSCNCLISSPKITMSLNCDCLERLAQSQSSHGCEAIGQLRAAHRCLFVLRAHDILQRLSQQLSQRQSNRTLTTAGVISLTSATPRPAASLTSKSARRSSSFKPTLESSITTLRSARSSRAGGYIFVGTISSYANVRTVLPSPVRKSAAFINGEKMHPSPAERAVSTELTITKLKSCEFFPRHTCACCRIFP